MSLPATAAGSSMPQCAEIGWPGQSGQASPAAASQTSRVDLPTLGEKVLRWIAEAGGHLQRKRIDHAFGIAAG